MCHQPFIILLALCLLAAPTLAQGRMTGSAPRSGGTAINGLVRYGAGGQPAEQINVVLETMAGSMVQQVRTDPSGKFRFTNVGQDLFRLVIRQPGYREIVQQIDLNTASSEYLQLTLVPDNTNAAATTTRTLNAAVPGAAQQEFEQGQRALLEAKNTKDGIAHLEKALKLHADYAAAHFLLGTAWLEEKQLDKAEHAFKRATQLEPQSAPAFFALGETYRRARKFNEAEQALQAGLKLEPKSAQGHFTLGEVYFDKGDLTKAGPEAGQALQLKPDFAEAYLLAGNLFLRARQAEQALPMFEQYLKLEPQGALAPQTREMVAKLKQALAEKKQ